ncbi:helix-turn-helix domain-containing protein [Allosphingosinicella sp.]|uniref:helix-turn-helix domain-containing protein n=1 Tax=Allosphingosinicella sp. TaxID=2823234 RepID=UPI002FC18ACD
MQGDLDSRSSEEIATTVREELARLRRSRQWLADAAGLSISTLEKALSGRRPFTLATVVRLEEALGRPLRGGAAPRLSSEPPILAPAELGAYARAGVSWLEGDYLTLRPSFNNPGAIYAYRLLIEWNTDCHCLTFQESARLDAAFTQAGRVSFPHLSGHIYLVTQESGQYRVAILGRPTISGELNGILTTLIVGEGSQLVPAATPLALVPCRQDIEPEFGLIEPGHVAYEDYRARLGRIVAGGFARLIG